MALPFNNLLFAVLVALLVTGCASTGTVPGGQRTEPFADKDVPITSDKARKLWQVFERYEGSPYRYGGTSPSGFDCSGFILTAFHEGLGQTLPRTTSQMLEYGDVVHPEQIRAGDLVFFRIDGKEQHAGIYMGSAQFIHASTSAGVTLSGLNDYYWRGRLTQARRFGDN